MTVQSQRAPLRCFVTGASGHIGSHLVRRLLADGHAVAILLRATSDRTPLAAVIDDVQVIEGDLDPASYTHALHEFAPDAVLHLAWSGITAADRNAPQQITGNVRATLDLLDAAHHCGAKLFLSTGSQAEYGHVSGPVREGQPLLPETAYGVAKAALSQLVPAYCARANMRFIWLRIFSVYGPGDSPDHILPSLIRKLQQRQRPSLTLGEQQWDYLYIDDVADAVARAVAVPDLGGVFNLASGRTVSLRSVIEQVRDLIDPLLPLGFGDVPYRHDQVMHLEGDITRFSASTGWQPSTSLADGLRRTVAWYQEHPEAVPE